VPAVYRASAGLRAPLAQAGAYPQQPQTEEHEGGRFGDAVRELQVVVGAIVVR